MYVRFTRLSVASGSADGRATRYATAATYLCTPVPVLTHERSTTTRSSVGRGGRMAVCAEATNGLPRPAARGWVKRTDEGPQPGSVCLKRWNQGDGMLRTQRGRLSLDQRQMIIELMINGENATAVARQIGCEQRTVRRWWSCWLEDQPLADVRGRRGRPRETTAEQDARIVQYAQERVFAPPAKLKRPWDCAAVRK